jgi:hypothetical protein
MAGWGSNSSTNTTTRGGCGGFNRGGCGRDRGGCVVAAMRAMVATAPNRMMETASVYGKEGHIALRCHKHFDSSFHGASEQRSVSIATNSNSYSINTNSYTDTGATDHITEELEKLTVRDKYHSNDQVHTASDAGMRINQVGQSFVLTLNPNLVLDNILYVPKANKSLVFVHHLT